MPHPYGMLCDADRKPRTKEAESGRAAPGGRSQMANSLMDFNNIRVFPGSSLVISHWAIPLPLLYMFLFQIWIYYWVLRQSTYWPTWKHHAYAYEEKGLWQIQISVWKVLKTLLTSDSNYKFEDLPRPFWGSIFSWESKSSLKALIHMDMVYSRSLIYFNSFFIFSAV